ncbi:MAG: nicotinate (nicotinamide) nucleotide adenylyltransferase, partial [Clostridia bacterium]|nr:nicotinate (nicotinamide) nucleotide adenylyltransferase [Clostridia bacterium]
ESIQILFGNGFMRVAIFGGAFNPVHREHVKLARAAVTKLNLDKIIIMPTAVSPHKGGRLSADFWQRFEMCRLAFAGIPQAEVSNYELTRGGISYTYLTCAHFASLYSDAERFFIIGADMLDNFPHWKNPEQILQTFSLAACAREDQNGFYECKERVEKMFSTTVHTIPYVGEKVSSTKIRTLAAIGERFGAYVTPQVCQYIEENELYAIEHLRDVKALLKPDRWAHTLRVAEMCAKNASRAGITERQAVIMGALHDCAKNLQPSSPYLYNFTPPEHALPPVVHQYAGAYVAEHFFGVKDKLILDAIACHATGKPDMNGAETLLYLCDMLEEGRTFDGVEELRKIFKKDLSECLFAAFEHQMKYLNSTGEPVDGLTAEAYNYLKEKNNGRK